ncbi:MAG: Gfo/Idh/MocA family oxidoreductase [Candidatus Omnitrophica bacterium]|nr:Gfo/Idh/MocA family oxidoreductase [Candidatus Omnitrophota bacterium]
MSKLNVAVIGVGRLGREHTRIYANLPQVNLVGICDTQPTTKKIALRYHIPFYKDCSSLLSASKIDALSIAVPTYLHYSIAKEVLKRGINILLEKPITPALKEANELLNLAHQRNLILQVGHIERFNPVIKKVKSMISKPLFIECQRLGPYASRIDDVGVTLDLMIHDLDIILHLINSEIEAVEATGAKILSDYEDIVFAYLKFKNGTLANLSASRVSRKKVRKIRIFQPDVYLSLDYLNSTVKRVQRIKGKIIRDKIKLKNKQEQLKSEIVSFVNNVRNRHIFQDYEAAEALKLALMITKKINDTQICEARSASQIC